MAFQVSPGVNVSEIDATTIIPAVGTSDAAIACAFQWGPADVITTISAEDSLAKIFGKPDNDTATNWLSASSFLAYAGGLQVVRTLDSTTHKNSTDGDSADVNVSILDQAESGYTEGNSITGAGAGVGAPFLVGATYTSAAATGEGLKITYAASTSGVVTSASVVDNADIPADPGDYADATYYSAILAGDNNAIIKLVVSAQTAAGHVITVVHGGSGYLATGEALVPILEHGSATKVITQVNTLTASDVDGGVVTAATLTVNPSHALAVGDRIAWDRGGTDATTSVFTISNFVSNTLVKNREDFDAQTLTQSSFVSRYPGSYGDNIDVFVHHNNGNTLKDGKATSGDYEINSTSIFDVAPTTSQYVLDRNGGTLIFDEIHIAVFDRTGIITGTAGYVLETYAHVSLCSDARNEVGDTNYYKEVVNNNSQYIWATGDWTAAFGTAANAADPDTDDVETNWESNTSSTRTDPFTDGKFSVRALGGGGGNNATANNPGNRYGADVGYGKFVDNELTDVSLLITGESDDGVLAGSLIDNIADVRKDCIVFYSPNKSAVVSSGATNSAKKDSVLTYRNSTTNKNSSYGVLDSGWKRMYDRYGDVYRDVPLNGDIAGLVAQTEATNDAWWSPAGYTRGNIKNAVKLHFNPPQAERDALYKAGVNPVVTFPGQGTILFGDKTTLGKPSAFDRINVRRLFIVLEKAISRAARFSLFEFNDAFTRSQFRGIVEPFLRDIKSRRGIFDYQVICDGTNNTDSVIDRNEFVGDIYIKPTRSINFIQLNFIAVRTGVSFSEVAGAV